MLWRLMSLISTVAFSYVACDAQPKYLASGQIVYSDSSQSLHQRAASSHRVRRNVLNSSEIQEALYAHNTARRQEGSSNMNVMTWNAYLASMAYDYATFCVWKHGQPYRDPATMPYNPVGQNLYAISGAISISISSAIAVWYNEKPYYDYDTLTCQPQQQCGHYTQVVWATSREVGCAHYFCPVLNLSNMTNAIFLVCEYGPAGNYEGEQPYLKGPACTQCDDEKFWCNQLLCDRNCPSSSSNCACLTQTCQNSGFFDSVSCSCCQPGYCGPNCSSTTCASSATKSEVLSANVVLSIGIILLGSYGY